MCQSQVSLQRKISDELRFDIYMIDEEDQIEKVAGE